MLADASTIATQFSGQGSMWQNPFAHPDPRAAIEKASVWFTAYPISMITKAGRRSSARSATPSCGRPSSDRGRGHPHRSGEGVRRLVRLGLHARASTGTSTGSAPTSTRRSAPRTSSVRCARSPPTYGGTVIDDIVPGHTGKGADFRLAEMKVARLSGHLPHGGDRPEGLAPAAAGGRGRDSANFDPATEDRLEKAGYIIGKLQRVIFFEEGVKETNWSATAPVPGPDGVERRWVYLHYFKEGQPSINWLDPTFAGMRLVIGDALHSLGDLGTGGLRLDANGFLGVEKSGEGATGLVGGPSAVGGGEPVHRQHGAQGRRVHLPGAEPHDQRHQEDPVRGADLSYDFVNRPAYHHAMATGDTEFLRLTLNLARDLGVEPVSLVHALQNHDEMTYELVHFATLHAGDFSPSAAGRSPARPGRQDPPGSAGPPDRRGGAVQRDLHPTGSPRRRRRSSRPRWASPI